MKPIVIDVKGVSKKFVHWENRNLDLKKTLVRILNGTVRNTGRKEILVLDNISFSIGKGEFVGLMGRNGAGKSTILKIISGIYSPTSGEVVINGKIAPVLELGAGFAEELSGYENIFLNASILGFGREHTLAVLKQIIEFSDLGEHIYAPVRNYSSGMLVRLAFSIACHMDAPIFLFDEVLAVGDIGFQKKCLNKIEELYRGGRSIILVTHNPEAVTQFCKRCIVFDNKKIVYDGDAEGGIKVYTSKVE